MHAHSEHDVTQKRNPLKYGYLHGSSAKVSAVLEFDCKYMYVSTKSQVNGSHQDSSLWSEAPGLLHNRPETSRKSIFVSIIQWIQLGFQNKSRDTEAIQYHTMYRLVITKRQADNAGQKPL